MITPERLQEVERALDQWKIEPGERVYFVDETDSGITFGDVLDLVREVRRLRAALVDIREEGETNEPGGVRGWWVSERAQAALLGLDGEMPR